jgi:hypothetical protein
MKNGKSVNKNGRQQWHKDDMLHRVGAPAEIYEGGLEACGNMIGYIGLMAQQ